MPTTKEMIERLMLEPQSRRLCGWIWPEDVPCEAKFSAVNKEFSQMGFTDEWFGDFVKTFAVIGTYDDTCDCIFWGIADVRGSRNPIHVHESTKNDPYAYYNVVKEEIAKRRAGCACRAQRL